jgi:hypothetical protein
MSTPIFPATGQRVVPFVSVDDEADLTIVDAKRNGSCPKPLKLRIFRAAIGSLLKFSWINIDGENCKVTFTKRE